MSRSAESRAAWTARRRWLQANSPEFRAKNRARAKAWYNANTARHYAGRNRARDNEQRRLRRLAARSDKHCQALLCENLVPPRQQKYCLDCARFYGTIKRMVQDGRMVRRPM